MKYKTKTLTEKLKFYIDKETGCHILTNIKVDKFTYSTMISHKGKRMPVQKHIYIEKFGEIDTKMVIYHTCGNPLCINPKHFILEKSHLTNKERKKLGIPAREMPKVKRKLTPEQVREIRSSPLGYYLLSKKYGVHKSLIYLVKKGKLYKDVL